MNRREFIATTAATGLAASTAAAANATASKQEDPMIQQSNGGFKLKYAPHFGHFTHSAGADLVDQLKFAADQGFTAWEDNGMAGREIAEQERIANAMADLGMEMGVFVGYMEWREPVMVRGGAETRDMLQQKMRDAVEVAARVNAKWCTIVPGPMDLKLSMDYQTANVVDCLKAMAEVCDPAGLTMVLEALNPYVDHPGLFLTRIDQGYLICKAVNAPSCKILDDLYHQQITEGNLIGNLNAAWEEIAYIQTGDHPGRLEPMTGEINYRNVFKTLHDKGFTGIVGMEHGKSLGGVEGEQKLIDAYRWADDFE